MEQSRLSTTPRIPTTTRTVLTPETTSSSQLPEEDSVEAVVGGTVALVGIVEVEDSTVVIGVIEITGETVMEEETGVTEVSSTVHTASTWPGR